MRRRLPGKPVEVLDNHRELGVRRRHLHGGHQPEKAENRRQGRFGRSPLSSPPCDSPVLDVVRETFGLSGFVSKHPLVGGEGLHQLDVSTQRQGVFSQEALVPGGEEKQ